MRTLEILFGLLWWASATLGVAFGYSFVILPEDDWSNLWDLLLTKGQSAVGILLEYYFQPGLDCTASDGQVLVVQTCLDRCLPPPVQG